MERHEALSEIGGVLQTISGIEGAFLGGSLANQSADDLSDIDLGIATQNSAEVLGAVHASFPLLVAGLGAPLACLDREPSRGSCPARCRVHLAAGDSHS